MKRTPKERIIYNNYDFDFEQGREGAFEFLGEAYGWETPDDVPDDKVWDYLYSESERNWEDETFNLKEFFGNGTFLLVGTVGRWTGPSEGGFIFGSFNELTKAWEDCDYIKIYDENGHFKIQCSHHDGTNYFEVKELTQAGEDYVDRNGWYMYPRELHTRLWNSSKYSRLPHFAHKVYGSKKQEYIPKKKSA